MDFIVVDNRDRRIFIGTSNSKRYLVLRCDGTNTRPLGLDAEVPRNVAYHRTSLLSTISWLHPEKSRDKDQTPKTTVPWS